MRRQRIIETVECDKCGEETDSPSTYTITFGTGGTPLTRAVDLCPDCAPPVAELLTMMRGMKRQPTAPTSERPDERPVAACGACGKEVAASSLASHIVKAHRASAPQPPQCPDCGTGIRHTSDMLKHRRDLHGYDHAAALLASIASPKRRRSR